MNDHPVDPARDGAAEPPRPPRGEDQFATDVRARLQSATAGLEPTLTFDEVIGETADGRGLATAPRRTWARAGAIGLAAASLVAVLVWTVRSPDRASVSSPSTPPTIASEPEPSTSASPATTSADTVTASTTDLMSADAVNILVTGADNNACIDPSSPFAGGFGDRTDLGERSDTIMIIRLDPSTERAAVLSFPRDLWVTIAGRISKNRINSAYVRDDPTRLLGTIYNNFGIEVDHFIQIDFCAFTTIVDGLGGVAVPFEFPARDVNTGLNVPQAGCFTFDGDHALAYVRSRKYQYMVDGKWKTDGVSDLGRISRQQDFLRRVLSAALDRGVTDPAVARTLISAIQDDVVVDQNLTISKMLEYLRVLASLSPQDVSTFQIEADGANVGGTSVLLPRLDGDNMQAVLALFRGDTVWAPSDGTDTATSVDPATASATVLETVVPEENPVGIVPPRDIVC
ncbi:MAG: LCP family protein [Actinobacteria bacterium]|nr:LCP family protein [Actinomycetota bacterium]